MFFLKNKMLCNEKKNINDILQLCVKITMLDTTSVYDSKSCKQAVYHSACIFWSALLRLNAQ